MSNEKSHEAAVIRSLELKLEILNEVRGVFIRHTGVEGLCWAFECVGHPVNDANRVQMRSWFKELLYTTTGYAPGEFVWDQSDTESRAKWLDDQIAVYEQLLA